MKILTSLTLFIAIALFALTGCNKEGGGAASVDTAALEKSFAPAESALKGASAKVVDAVKKADYQGALKELQALASNAKLTDDQKKAINDLIEQVKKAVSEAGSKALGEAQKALGK